MSDCARTRRNHRKDAAQRRAASKRAFGRLLNDRPIGDRIGKWHAQLNDIGPGLFQPQDELLGFRQAWIARHEIRNERFLLPGPEAAECPVEPAAARGRILGDP